MLSVGIEASAGVSNSDADPAVDGDGEANSLYSGVDGRLKDFSESRLGSRLRGGDGSGDGGRSLEGLNIELLVGVAVAVPLVDDVSGRVVGALVVLVHDLEEFSFDGDDSEVLGVGIVNTPVPVSVSVVSSVTLEVEDEVVDVVESVEGSVGGDLELLSVGSIAVF